MSGPKVRVAIVAAEFNQALIDAMIATAQAELTAAHAELVQTVRVPGAYEVPLIADLYLARPDVDAVVVLGHIERGETLHGEVMGHVVHAALVEMQIRHHKPIGIGIIGPGATEEQAQARKVGAAQAAVRAALHGCALVQASGRR